MKKRIYLVSLIGLLALASCDSGSSSSTDVGQNPPPASPPVSPPASSKAKLITLTIKPKYADSLVLAAGFSRQYQAIGYYDDGSSSDLTRDVTWSSGDNNCVSLNKATPGLVIGATIATKCNAHLSISLNNESSNSQDYKTFENKGFNLNVKKLTLSNVKIIAPMDNIPLGLTIHSRAVGYYNDGSYSDITSQVDWSSTNPTAVTANNDSDKGAIHALKTDDAEIKVSYGSNITNHLTVKVQNISLKVINIVAEDYASTNIHTNTSSYYKAYGTYSNNSIKDITANVNWSVSNPKVLAIEHGKVTALASSNGLDVQIEASAKGIDNELIKAQPVKLKVSSSSLTSLIISSDNGNKLLAGIPNQYHAIGMYSDGVQDLTKNVYWSVNTQESNVAIISNQEQYPGLLTVMAGNNLGNNYVVARFGSNASSLFGSRFNIVESSITSLSIVGDPSTITEAPVGIRVAYKAIANFADGTTRDVTKSAYWSSGDSNLVTPQINPGEFDIESIGNTSLKVSYVNLATGNTMESNLNITINDKSITAINIEPSNLSAIASVGDIVTYDLSARLVDSSGSSYPALVGTVQWSMLNNNGLDHLTIDPSGKFSAMTKGDISGAVDIRVNVAGKLTIESSIHFDLDIAKPTSTMLTLPPSSGPFPDIDPRTGILDHILYISQGGILNWCPVANYSNSNLFIAAPLIKKSQCRSSNYSPYNVTINNIIKYNNRYNKAYLVTENNVVISDRKMDTTIQNTNFAATGGFAFDDGESIIYIPTITESKLVINQCHLLDRVGLLDMNTCTSKMIESGLTDVTRAYILIYKDKYAYFKLAYNDVLKSHWLRCKINQSIISNACTNIDSQTGATNYFDSRQYFSKPTLHKTSANKTFIYVNQFTNSMTNNVILASPIDDATGDLSPIDGNAVGSSLDQQYTLPPGGIEFIVYRHYDQMAFDDIKHWVYYGTSTSDHILTKCSFANGFNNYGRPSRGCVGVTAFKDTFAGIAFIPGSLAKTPYNPQIIESADDTSAKIFFISQSYGRSDESYNPYSVVGCSNANSIIESKDCNQYTLKWVGPDNQLAYSKVYKKVYVTSSESIIYTIDPNTHKIGLNPTVVGSNVIAFNNAGTRAYLINSTKESQATLYNCKVSLDGSITNNCVTLNLGAESLGRVTPSSIINYKDKALYLLLTNPDKYLDILYKCTMMTKSGDISSCSVIPFNYPDVGDTYEYLYKIAGINTSDFGINLINFAALSYSYEDPDYRASLIIVKTNYYSTATIDHNNAMLTNQDNLYRSMTTNRADSFSYAIDEGFAYIGHRQLDMYDGLDENSLYTNTDTGISFMRKCDISNKTLCSDISKFKPYNSTSLIYISQR